METLESPPATRRRTESRPLGTREPPRGTAQRADVQGLRAIAVLLVVAFHAGLPVPGGFAGVDVFFAISGFVIAGSLVRELRADGRIDLPAFYGRRVRRLLPALGVVLVATAALGVLASPLASQETGALTGIAASLFSANVYLGQLPSGYFDAAATLDPLLHTWTLAVEEQFYLVFPALLLLGWRLRQRAAATALVSLASIGSLLLALALAGTAFGFYGSPTRAWEFGAGALIALAGPWASRLPRSSSALLGVLGLAAIGLTAFGVRETAGDPRDIVLAVAGTGALLLATGGPTARLLSTRPAVAVGNLSYSLYLWHWPLIVFAVALWPQARAAAAAAALGSVVPAWLSYRFVEEPIRRGDRFRGRRVLRLAAVCVLVPIAASAALLGANRAIAGSEAVRSWETASAKHADELRGCNSTIPLSERGGDRCLWNRAAAAGRVVLVGDSQAGQLTEPVVQASRRLGLQTLVVTANACPFAEVSVEGSTVTGADCARFLSGTLAALERTQPEIVVVASRSDYYVSDPAIALDGLTDTGRKAEVWREGTLSMLRRLERAGARVVLVHPIPQLGAEPLGCAAVAILLRHCTGDVDRADAVAARRPAVVAERAAVATTARTTSLDFDEVLCERTRCRSARDGRWTYRDVDHLSVAGALLLTDELERALLR